MADEVSYSTGSGDLRRRAEDQARQASWNAHEDVGALSPEQVGQVLHDLRVHQIELEMQNEELRRAHEELAASQARYFDLYNLAPVGYLSVSEPGMVVEANLTFAGMLGVDRSSAVLLRQPLSRFVLPEDQDTYYLHRKRLLESGVAQVCELRLVRADGTSFWAKLDAALGPLSDHEAVCRVAVSDISARKQAEADKAALQEQINQEERLETVGRLAGGVAHDLNNSLMPVLGYAELLLDDPKLDDAAAAFVRQIISAGERTRDLVQQLLAYGRKQMGTFDLLDLNDVVEGIIKLLVRTTPEDISVKLVRSPGPLPVMGDATRIEEAITRLAVNAEDAMPVGGLLTIETSLVEIDAECAATAGLVPAGRYALVSISDTGEAMGLETQSHIFEPFFTTRVMGRGTGLGLAMVHSLVEQHGGHIFATSATGAGTTFRIYLPAVERAEATAADRSDRGADRREAGKGECILLVEDDAGVRALTRTVLERLGYTVVVAESGSQALALLETCVTPVHLVLTDVVMPGMNGRDLVVAIQRDHPQTRALFMSGHADAVIAHHGVVDPGTSFIQKPFSINALANKVRELLDA